MAMAPASGRPLVEQGRGRGFLRAMTLALQHPSAWPIALAGFLVRGGILLFLLPVVVLPTPTGVATAFGSDIIAVAIAGPTPATVQLAATAILAALGWLVLGSVVGAAADIELAGWGATSGRADTSAPAATPGPAAGADRAGRRPRRDVPVEPRAAVPARSRRGLVGRVAIVRLACHLPLAIVSVWAAARIVAAVYREYISPGDLSVPLSLRVAGSVPDAIVLLVVAWLIGEALGGLAARAIVLDGRPAGPAIRAALASVVFHPLSAGMALATTTIVLVSLVAPLVVASALLWGRLGSELLGAGDAPTVLAATLGFIAAWLVGLLAAAVAATLRSSIWTWHALRVRDSRPIALPSSIPAAESSVAEA